MKRKLLALLLTTGLVYGSIVYSTTIKGILTDRLHLSNASLLSVHTPSYSGGIVTLPSSITAVSRSLQAVPQTVSAIIQAIEKQGLLPKK